MQAIAFKSKQRLALLSSSLGRCQFYGIIDDARTGVK